MSGTIPAFSGARLLLAVAFVLIGAQWSPALEVPPLKGRVNDYAGILSPATVQQLESTLQDFEATDSTQIIVLTIPSLDGESLEEFSLRVVETWKPGQRKLDNGALLLIAKNDRKLRIEVGYGLEGRLTDLTSGRIIRDIITPQFKAGDFNQGVIAGVNAMVAAVKGEFTASADTVRRHNRISIDPGAFFMLIVVVFSVMGRLLSRIPWIAGGVGAVLAPVMGGLLLGISGWGLLFLAILGFIIGLVPAQKTSGSGSGSGFWTGSGSSGGGFSSGGFSGGGGSFGGGGASGSW